MNRLIELLAEREACEIHLVLVCGSRNWADRQSVFRAIEDLANQQRGYGWFDMTVLHGGARGADLHAGECAEQVGGLGTREVAANWDGLGRAAGPDRNRRMLALGPDLVIAFKDDAQGWDGLGPYARGGTEHMCRIALAAGVSVLRYSHEHQWEKLSA